MLGYFTYTFQFTYYTGGVWFIGLTVVCTHRNIHTIVRVYSIQGRVQWRVLREDRCVPNEHGFREYRCHRGARPGGRLARYYIR